MRFIPLMPNTKIPYEEDWQTKGVSLAELEKTKQPNDNIALVLDKNHLIIDVDVKKESKGLQSYNALCDRIPLLKKIKRSVLTPSGGFHIYLSKPEAAPVDKLTLRAYPGIEFLSYGRLTTIPPSSRGGNRYQIHPDYEAGTEVEFQLAPVALLKLLEVDRTLVSTKKINKDLSQTQVEYLLNEVDPEITYDRWLKIGMALHKWNAFEGLVLWERFSKQWSKYEKGECEKKWNSFKKSDVKGNITIGTLDHIAREDNRARNKHIAKLETINDSEALKEQFVSICTKETLSEIDYSELISYFIQHYKFLTGIVLSKSSIKSELVKLKKKPEWAMDWVYVSEQAKFYHIDKLTPISLEAFCLINAHRGPVSSGGTRQNVAKYLADLDFLKVVDGMAYKPDTLAHIYTRNNKTYLNICNHKSIPKPAEAYTKKSVDYIKVFNKHLKMIMKDDDAELYLNYLTYLVQNPGKKMRWTILLQSIEGMGKTYLSHVLKKMFGDDNVGKVSATQVQSSFNGWAKGKMINIVEELHISGSNRYNVLNSLKELLTDDVIMINEKGVNQYKTENTTNYLFFTNYAEAIPINMMDRRWCVIYSPLKSLDDLQKLVNVDTKDYFRYLYEGAEKYYRELKKYLLERKIPSSFLKIHRAPVTDSKEKLIAALDQEVEGYNELEQLTQQNEGLITEDFLVMNVVKERLADEYGIKLRHHDIIKVIKRLGYYVYDKQLMVSKTRYRCWIKHVKMTHDELHKKIELAVNKDEIEQTRKDLEVPF